MPFDRTSIGPFLLRILLPLGAFALLLSLTFNIFLIATRPDDSGAMSDFLTTSSSSDESPVSVLEPMAFGIVKRPVAMKVQTVDLSGATLKGFSSYAMPPGIIPAIPETMPVYRDQGVTFDAVYFVPFFQRVRAPLDAERMQLLPDKYSFRSADGIMRVSFSAATRTLSVTRTTPAQAVDSLNPADDAEVLAIAVNFAQSLGVDTSTLHSPLVKDIAASQGQPARTYVRWPLSIGSFPVIAADGTPVSALAVQVGRLSHKPLSATLTLISPEVLASAPYPVLSPQDLSSSFESGGLLPAPFSAKRPVAIYSQAEPVYLLLSQDAQYPLYLIPAVKAVFPSEADCKKKCSSAVTILPALNPANFDWREAKKK